MADREHHISYKDFVTMCEMLCMEKAEEEDADLLAIYKVYTFIKKEHQVELWNYIPENIKYSYLLKYHKMIHA